MELTCAFSGYRPEKLPWGEDELDPRCVALKIQMERQLRALCREGCLRYLCGMARGTDIYFLEILGQLREEFPIHVKAVIPCIDQTRLWPEHQRKRYLRGLDFCDSMEVLEDGYSQGCMLRRNYYMVDHADILMTVFDGTPGGTAATVRYARARGRRILSIWR